MDYKELLNDKTKRHILLDEFEDQKNCIKYFVDNHEPAESVPMLEKLVEMMSGFLKENLPNEDED